jgi:hypothetical protein
MKALLFAALLAVAPLTSPCDDVAWILAQKCAMAPQHCTTAAQCWYTRPNYCYHNPTHTGCPRKPPDLYVPTPPPTPTPQPKGK